MCWPVHACTHPCVSACCSAPQLDPRVKARLSLAIREVGVDVKKQPPRYYNFVLRVAKHFAFCLNKDADPLHVRRKVLCSLAVKRAKRGVDAASIKSFEVESVHETFLPVMESLFTLEGKGLREGSQAWIEDMKSHIHDVPFATLAAHPKLLKFHILKQIHSPDTDVRGCPFLRDGEQVPDGTYTTMAASKRLSTHYR